MNRLKAGITAAPSSHSPLISEGLCAYLSTPLSFDFDPLSVFESSL